MMSRTMVVGVVVATAWASPANADTCARQFALRTSKPSADEATAAKTLFAHGVALLQSARVDEACKLFDASFNLDQQIGTSLNVADCRERKGNLVEAHALFTRAGEEATKVNDTRAEFALERAAAVAKKLVTVRFKLEDATQHDLAIQLEGCTLTQDDLSEPRLVAPGVIVVTAAAPERRPFVDQREAAAGSEVEIAIPSLEVDTHAEALRKAKEAEALAAIQRRVAEEIKTQREAAKRFDRHPSRIYALVAGGVGVAGLITGVVFGVNARSDQQKFDDNGCGSRIQPLNAAGYAECKDIQDDGKRDALLASTFLVGGAAILAASVGVYLLDPGNIEKPRATVSVTAHSVQMVVRW